MKRQESKPHIHSHFPQFILRFYFSRKNSYLNLQNTKVLKTKRKDRNVSNIPYTMDHYPRNGWIGDTEPALNIAH